VPLERGKGKIEKVELAQEGAGGWKEETTENDGEFPCQGIGEGRSLEPKGGRSR
jgi:hypothetical protein